MEEIKVEQNQLDSAATIKKCFKKIMLLFLTNPLFIYEALSEIKKKEKISNQFIFFLNQTPFLIELTQEEKNIICQKKNLLVLRENIYHQYLKPTKRLNFFRGIISIQKFNEQLNLELALIKEIIQKLKKQSFLEIIKEKKSIHFSIEKIEANIDNFKNTLFKALPNIEKEQQIKISQKVIETYRKTTELYPSSLAHIFYAKIKNNPDFSKGFLEEQEFFFKKKAPSLPKDLEIIYSEAYAIFNHHQFTVKRTTSTDDRRYYIDYAHFLVKAITNWFLEISQATPNISQKSTHKMNQLTNEKIATRVLSYLSFIPGDCYKTITNFYQNKERLNYDYNRKIVQKLYF